MSLKLPTEYQICRLTGQQFETVKKLGGHLRRLGVSPYAYFDWIVPGEGPLHPSLIKRNKTPQIQPFTLKEYTYKSGYHYVIQKKKKIQIHRYILESYIGRDLDGNEIPYHLDGDKSNNHPNNLGILPFLDIPSQKRGKNINSSQKGKRAEAHVAQELQDWWGCGVFRRTPQSGAWDQGGDFGAKGDIITTEKDFPLSVEVKNDEEWRFPLLFTSKKSKLHKFWQQSADAARTEGLSPVIVFTRNFLPIYFGMELEAYERSRKDLFGFAYRSDEYNLYFTLFSEFLKMSPEEVRAMYK